MVSVSRAFVLIDGIPVAAESASVSVFDRGFLYGDSVFEALRTYGGEPFMLDEHMTRLEESARRVRIQLPIDRAAFTAEVRSALSRAGFSESYVRVILTRGRSEALGLDLSRPTAPLRVVLVLPLEAPPESKYERGIDVITYRSQRVADGTPAAGAKVANYLTSVLALEEARARGAEEALLVDGEGRVLEGTTSNVFGVRDGRLVTPPEELGILAGITRARLFRVAQSSGVELEIRAFTVAELTGFDEVFISSSIRELLAVITVDGQPIADGRPGPVFRRLLAAFRLAAARPG